MDATAITRRLLRDLKELERDPPFGISAAPKGNNIMLWNAVICGPKETPFEDGTFKLTIEFSEEYPFKPPEVKFVSKMFHPNIFEEDGQVDTHWSPAYTYILKTRVLVVQTPQTICNFPQKDCLRTRKLSVSLPES